MKINVNLKDNKVKARVTEKDVAEMTTDHETRKAIRAIKRSGNIEAFLDTLGYHIAENITDRFANNELADINDALHRSVTAFKIK